MDDSGRHPLDPERVEVVLGLLQDAWDSSRPIDEPHVISTCIEGLKLLKQLRIEAGVELPPRRRTLTARLGEWLRRPLRANGPGLR